MNDRHLLTNCIELLNNFGIKTIIFGGWAEELIGIIEPREHKDIDLFYMAENFDLVDKLFLKNHELKEIPEKHFYHKRAFIYNNVMIELFLVQKDNNRFYTYFWNEIKYYWPVNTFNCTVDKLKVASKDCLMSFRNSYKHLSKNF